MDVASKDATDIEAVKEAQQQQQLPRNNREYGTHEYWENRFTMEPSFEWLLDYAQLAAQIQPVLNGYSKESKSDVRILMVGCGNAPFSADMYDDGFTNIVNVDYSQQVIRAMREQHRESRPFMQWHVMDMTDMSDLDDGSFDVVLDKAAMDALMTHEGDVWNPAEDCIVKATRMCEHIRRVLVPGGTFVQISLAQPHFRKKYLLGWHRLDSEASEESVSSTAEVTYSKKFLWTFRSEAAGQGDKAGGFGHYLYVMEKQTPQP